MMHALVMGVLAGLVAVLVTVAIERWGGVVGGLLATLPTTIVPAAIGLHAALPTELAFQEALAMTPTGMLLDAGFLLLWRELPAVLPVRGVRARLVAMTGLSFSAWLVGAVCIVGLSDSARALGWSPVHSGILATVSMVAVGAAACWNLPPAPGGTRPVGAWMLLARGAFAGAAIAVALVIAQQGHGLIAGVAAVFPAIFFTSMAGLWISQGEAVPAGAVGPMMLGATSVAAFSMVAGVAVPVAGLGAGLAGSWLVAVALTTVPARMFLGWRRSVGRYEISDTTSAPEK